MSRTRAMSSGCLVLFGLPFLAVGIGVTYYAISCWSTYGSSADWPRVQARIVSVEFESHDGDDSTTYSVACTYTYEFEGGTYRGDRVTIMGGSTSEYDAHRKRYDILKEHLDREEPIPVYVNPASPADAFLFREADTFMYAMVPFGLVFALVGGGVVVGGARGILVRRRAARGSSGAGAEAGVGTDAAGAAIAAVAADSGELWRGRADWREFRAVASPLKDIALSFGMGLFILLFMSIFLVAMADAPWFVGLFIMLFVAGGMALVFRGMLLTASFMYHGTSELVFSEMPVRPGGKLAAVVRTRRSTIDPSSIALTLACTETHGSGDDRSTSTVYSHDFHPAQATLDDGGATLVPVLVDIPSEHGATRDADPSRTWTLTMKAGTFPLALKARFELPVFAVADAEAVRRPPNSASAF